MQDGYLCGKRLRLPHIKKMENELELKWDRLRRAMVAEGVDGCLVTTNRNLYWLTGRVVNGYFYLPAEGAPRLFLKRPAETGIASTAIRKPEQLPEAFAQAGLPLPRRLMLEDGTLPYNEYVRLQRSFAASETVGGSQLLRRLRMIKTPWEIEQMRLSARRQAEAERDLQVRGQPLDIRDDNAVLREIRRLNDDIDDGRNLRW